MAARSQPLAFKDWQSKPGDLHLETFKEKGRGSYGVVRVGEWQERSVAVKTLHDILLEADGRQKEELVKEECLKLRRLDDHRRVVKLIATFRDERGRPLLVMEALEESLEDYLLRNVGKLSVLRQISIVSELADGLAYLHENNIVHRDLKPANVLMGKDGHIRIADLGQAKLLANIEQLMTTLQPGTILFLPPETLQDGGSPYTFSIDCFSLGVVALCVATQSLPTCGFAQIGTVEEAVRRKKDLVKLPKGHPLKAIILGCLQNTPSLRPRSFFIKEHTQALMEIEGCRSRLEERDKTVIQLREELQTQKEQTEYLREVKEMEIERCRSRLEERDKTVIQLREELQTQKEQTEYLRKDKEFAFCRECRDAFHQGKCSVDRAQAEVPRAVHRKQIDVAAFGSASWKTAKRKYLRDKTKPCPQCKANTEKSKGCMHMTCLVCKFEWCWMCSKQWSRQCQDSHWFG